MKTKKKSNKDIKIKLNFQNLFCFASFIFILTCIFWYGGRLIYFYQDSKKTLTEEATVLARVVKNDNEGKATLKLVGQDYYFNGDVANNYVKYSNMLWRIIRVNKDNSIVLVTDDIVSTLAYGVNSSEYSSSVVMKWLNDNGDDNSGIFENILNEKEKYLIKNSTCIDTIDNMENNKCEEFYNDAYLGLLSIQEYVYTGSNKGFINNGKYSYLANKNIDNEIWYINSDGKLDVSSGDDILGIKATITLSPNIELKSGNGTLEEPYQIEETNGFIGSYVKLGDDMWRISKEKDGVIQLVLNDIIGGSDEFKHIYSNKTYYHNDTIKGSLAYYLNHTYYNSLSYRDLILENTYENGFYGNDTDYDYSNIIGKTIQTKVSLPSIHDVIWNDSLGGYFTNTGISQNSSLIYVHKSNGLVTNEKVTTDAFVVPCISIQKDKLLAGTGTLDDPYRTE